MNLSRRLLILTIPGLLLLFSLTTPAQWDKKPYAEWTEKDAQKVLNDSPWGKTQSFDSPMEGYKQGISGRQGTSTATTARPPEARNVFFRVRLLSAGEVLESIVVAVTSDASDAGSNVQQAAALLRRDNAEFKNTAFLEIKGGKRIFLQEFKPAGADGFGARFIFQRLVDGKPFITPESEEIHFVAPLSDTYRLDRRFKIKDMMYEGKLEY